MARAHPSVTIAMNELTQTKPPETPNLPAIRRPMVGLALGSGIARGFAHIGVLRALDEAGIKPDVICGTSIGAVVGGCYLAGKLDTLEEWARSLNRTSMLRYVDMQVTGGGLIGGRRLIDLLENHIGARDIESLPARYAAIATELETGHEYWLQSGPLVAAMRASYALPGVFAPMKIDGRWLVDGALVNPVPVSVCRALGARLVIAVNLNADVFMRPLGRKEPQEQNEENSWFGAAKMLKPANMLMRQIFGQPKDTPSLFSNMVGALNIMQDRLTRSRLAGDPADVMVRPRLGQVGLLDFNEASDAIAAGRAAMELALPNLKEALEFLQ